MPPLPFPPRRPLALSACSRSGGPLSAIDLSDVFHVALSLLGVSSPLSGRCSVPLVGAGLALTGPPAGAARAAPVGCAGKYPAPSVVTPWLVRSPPTGPPAATAVAAPVGCAAGCPAPPDPVSVLAAASTVPIATALRGAAPSPPSVSCSWVGWVGGGFSSPPPSPRPYSPRWYRDAVRDPGVSSPLGPPPFFGVESSHDDSTPPPFCRVELSYHDSPHTPLPIGGRIVS